jgi:protein-S-isoprenylcysteine O-methyltransferase Ste14
VESGIYRVFQHPLFWAGILFSLGLALVTLTPTSLAIAAVNVLYGFVYNGLENRRLRRVFGGAYAAYAARVPGVPTHRVLARGLRALAARGGRAPGDGPG